jgi:hypothetical protein
VWLPPDKTVQFQFDTYGGGNKNDSGASKGAKHTFRMEDQVKRIVKLLDHAVQKVTGGVEAGACVPNAFYCCYKNNSLYYETSCTGTCVPINYVCTPPG